MPSAFKPILVLMILLALLGGCAVRSDISPQVKCIKLGQEWSYDAREGEQDSRITIVEAFTNKDRKRFYIIRVTGVKIDAPNFRQYFPDGVPYFVISEPGLEATLRYVVGESKWNRFYDMHYQKWRRELQHPDYYGFTVKEKLNTIEELLDTKLGA